VVGVRELIELLSGVSVLMKVAQSTALLLRMMGRVGMLLGNAVIARSYVSCAMNLNSLLCGPVEPS
jgi:hypothetical protein